MTEERSGPPRDPSPGGERPAWRRKPQPKDPEPPTERYSERDAKGPPPIDHTLMLPGGQASEFPEIPGVTFTREIGRGGMGIVYEGKQGYLDRRVAVKLLAGESQGPDFTRRFQREAKLLAALNHPHIVACYQAGVASDGRCYLAMEYIDGPDLMSWIEKNGPLGPAQAVAVCKDVAAALAYAYRSGIIHRDIKPANVLLQRDAHASSGAVFPWKSKLADLGLARPESKEQTAIELTAQGLTVQGTVMGSPPTMAPEQFDSPDQVDFRTDIYGLGCVLFHCLTGKLAFPQSSLTSLIAAKTRGEAPDPRQLRADLSKELAQLVRDMLAPEREKRPQSYEVLLRRFEGPFPVSARKNKTAIVAGAVALAAALGFTAWHFAGPPTPPPGKPEPIGPPPRIQVAGLPDGGPWLVKSLPVDVAGQVLVTDEGLKAATLTVDGNPVALGTDGRFSIASFQPKLDDLETCRVHMHLEDAWKRPAELDFELVVDGAPPELRWVAPAVAKEVRPGVWLTDSDALDLALDVKEPHGPKVEATRAGSAETQALGSAKGTGEQRVWNGVPLVAGENGFEARAQDELGNASSPALLRIKRTYPLSLVTPAVEAGVVRVAPGAHEVSLQLAALTDLSAVSAQFVENAKQMTAKPKAGDPRKFELLVPLPESGERFALECSGTDVDGDQLASLQIRIERSPATQPGDTEKDHAQPDAPPQPTVELLQLAPGQKLALLDGSQGLPPAAWTARAGKDVAQWSPVDNGFEIDMDQGLYAVDHLLPEPSWKLSGNAQFLRRRDKTRARRLAIVIGFAQGGGVALEQSNSAENPDHVEIAVLLVSSDSKSGWPRMAVSGQPSTPLSLPESTYDTLTPVDFEIEWNGKAMTVAWKLQRDKEAELARCTIDPSAVGLAGPPRSVGLALESDRAIVRELLLERLR